MPKRAPQREWLVLSMDRERRRAGDRRLSAAAATIPRMPAEHPAALIPAESPAPALSPVPAGPAAAAELIARVRAKLPHLADLGQRELSATDPRDTAARGAQALHAACVVRGMLDGPTPVWSASMRPTNSTRGSRRPHRPGKTQLIVRAFVELRRVSASHRRRSRRAPTIIDDRRRVLAAMPPRRARIRVD